MPKSKPQGIKVSQRQAFINAARKADCDENEATWEKQLRKIAKVNPPAKKAKK